MMNGSLGGTNYGSATTLKVQGPRPQRAIFRFNQAAIDDAVDGELISATLRVWSRDPTIVTPETVDVHALTQAWSESNVTWFCADDLVSGDGSMNCSGGTAWATAGGLFAASATDSTVAGSWTEGHLEFDVTEDVQQFVDGLATNHGWIVKKTPLCQVA